MVHRIQIDDQVRSYLDQRAWPGETPGRTLKRLLGMDRLPAAASTVAAALWAHPGATATDLARAAGVSYPTAVRVLNALAREGTATRTPAERTRPDRRGNAGYRWWPAGQ
jgi:DNA-binding MarR family transcriptional regulator